MKVWVCRFWIWLFSYKDEVVQPCSVLFGSSRVHIVVLGIAEDILCHMFSLDVESHSSCWTLSQPSLASGNNGAQRGFGGPRLSMDEVLIWQG